MNWRPWPRSLFGRIVLLLAGGLLAAQLATALLYLRDRGEVFRQAVGFPFLQQTAALVRLLEPLAAAERTRLIGAIASPFWQLALTAEPPADAGDGARPGLRARRYLQRELGGTHEVRVATAVAPELAGWGWPGHPAAMHRPRHHAAPLEMVVAVRLGDGQWLESRRRFPDDALLDRDALLLGLGWVLASSLLLGLLAARWLTRPLATLGEAARGLGRDLERAPLPERGPEEVRATAAAFNTMQQRIRRFLRDRSRFLAAVSHDLRTPITRLRLRLEMMPDGALRERLVADLDEMQQMVDATLEFMRDAEGREPRRPLDLGALLEGIEADANEARDGSVRLRAGTPPHIVARPLALKRALTNLVQNAIRYAGAAELEAAREGDEVVIRVLDRGPGIPDADLARVLEPFQRVDRARTPGQGGSGLGLNIARNAVHAEGGTLSLHNRDGGGLEVVVRLPLG